MAKPDIKQAGMLKDWEMCKICLAPLEEKKKGELKKCKDCIKNKYEKSKPVKIKGHDFRRVASVCKCCGLRKEEV